MAKKTALKYDRVAYGIRRERGGKAKPAPSGRFLIRLKVGWLCNKITNDAMNERGESHG
ncbi:hypothetical protein BSNK01_30860 [Bacillaceae bacterium]